MLSVLLCCQKHIALVHINATKSTPVVYVKIQRHQPCIFKYISDPTLYLFQILNIRNCVLCGDIAATKDSEFNALFYCIWWKKSKFLNVINFLESRLHEKKILQKGLG